MNYLHLSDNELIENFESASPWFVGLYMVNLIIEWTTSGLVWSVIGLLVSIVMLIITLLPTNHFLKQAEE